MSSGDAADGFLKALGHLRCPPGLSPSFARGRGLYVVDYTGRAGNSLIQYAVGRHLAARLGFALLAEDIAGLGPLPSVGAAAACGAGAASGGGGGGGGGSLLALLAPPTLFRVQPLGDFGPAALAAAAHARAAVLCDPRPRVVFQDWEFEQADVVISALASAAPLRGDPAPHPWLPPAVSAHMAQVRAELAGGGRAPFLLPSELREQGAWEATLVLHVRLGDVAREDWRRAAAAKLAARDGLLAPLGAPAAPGRRAGMRLFRAQLPWYTAAARDLARQEHALLPHAPPWADPARAPEFLAAAEGDPQADEHAVLPLSYYRAIIEGVRARAPLGAAARHVLLVTDGDSVGHPLVAALRKEFRAHVVSGSVASDFAVLLAARELVAAVSTFSWLAGVLGAARAIHYPHAAYFSVLAHKRTCMLVPPAVDGRFVFHDGLRAAAARRHAAVVAAGGPVGAAAALVAAACPQWGSPPYFQTSAAILTFDASEPCFAAVAQHLLTRDARAAAGGGAPRLCTDAFVFTLGNKSLGCFVD